MMPQSSGLGVSPPFRPALQAPSGASAQLQRHLLMALRCHEEAARLQLAGDADGALRQQRLMGVFLHNALAQLPIA